MTYSTQGIVLKKIPSGEADASVVIYTRDFGKLRCHAQGVKKEEAKLKGHVEPFSLISIQFVIGTSGERLTYAQMLYSWPRIRNDFDRLAAAAQVSEQIDGHCLPGQADNGIWELLLGSLAALDHESMPAVSDIMDDFEKCLVSSLGYGEVDNISVLNEPVRKSLG